MNHPDLPDDIDLDTLHEESVLTTKQAAALAGVRPSAITNWRERGYRGPDGTWQHLRNIGTKERPRYLAVDVARAEHATRRPNVLRNSVEIRGFQLMKLREAHNAA